MGDGKNCGNCASAKPSASPSHIKCMNAGARSCGCMVSVCRAGCKKFTPKGGENAE